MNRRLVTYAALALVAFCAWTVVVRVGIDHGSRRSMWVEHPFGTWPEAITTLDASSTIEFSIYAPLDAPGGAGTPHVIGRAEVGPDVDSADSDNINASRYVAPSPGGEVHSIAVYVAGPVDTAPYDRFQIAIYSDDSGSPARRLAVSATATLQPDAWNWAEVDVHLDGGRAYWLAYNSNGRTSDVNNVALHRAILNPIDGALQDPVSGPASSTISRITSFGNANLMALAVVGLAVVAALRRRWAAAVALLAGYAAALVMAFVLRWLAFEPYLYPSGHALRTAYVAVAVGWTFRRRAITVAAWAFSSIICVAAIRERGHVTDEIVGGLLLGVAAGLFVQALVAGRPSRREAPDPGNDEERGPSGQRPLVSPASPDH